MFSLCISDFDSSEYKLFGEVAHPRLLVYSPLERYHCIITGHGVLIFVEAMVERWIYRQSVSQSVRQTDRQRPTVSGRVEAPGLMHL